MIDVALLGIIRRWHLRDQISLREIAKRLGISRNTVRRYLRSETVEPAYADRRSASALDVYTFKLSAWLKTESTKSRKQKRSLKQMHADLCVLGFEGSYDRVAAFARQWKVDQLDRVNAASKGTTPLFAGKKKLKTRVISESNHITGKIAKQTDICEAKRKGPPSGGPFKYWCWLQDLNPPPPDYKSGALPDELSQQN